MRIAPLGEDPVYEPLPASIAVEPQLASLRIAADEIIAADLAAIPPAAFDALRAGEQAQLRGCEIDAERARPRQQPQRPSRWIGRKRHRARRCGAAIAPGMLGTMIGVETELAHRVIAKPCPQALDPLLAALAMTMGSGKELAILPRERRDFFR